MPESQAEGTAQGSTPARRPPAGLAATPAVSVVIAMRDEERHIGECLDSLDRQTYPSHLIETIVVDGRSGDRSREVVQARALHDARLRVLDNPVRLSMAGFNTGIRASTGSVIALLSAHSHVAPTYLEECVRVLLKTGADNVGGRLVSEGRTPMGRAIAAAYSSPFGVGGARHHYATSEGEVATLFPGCFRREVFDRLGLFDESLPQHGDYEFNHRIRKAGGRIWYSPTITASYSVRQSLGALARQQFRYGHFKTVVARRNLGVVRPYHLVPPVFTGALACLGAAAPFSRRARTTLAATVVAYGTVVAVATLSVGRRLTASETLRLPLVIPTLHLTWGAGALSGVLPYGRSQARHVSASPEPRDAAAAGS